MKRYLLIFCLLICQQFIGQQAMAAAPAMQPFDKDSLATIKTQYSGRPFVLVLWSVTCHFCVEGMGHWGALQKKYPAVPIVLLNTDAPAEHAIAQKILSKYKLGQVSLWAFADAYVEPLKWSVDPNWRGELPRTYLFDAAHLAQGISGELDRATLTRWLQQRR